MNAGSWTSTAPSARPGTDPVFGQMGGLIRTGLHSLRLQWFLYRTKRRQTGVIESVRGMNAHMLRDIGAPDEMIGCAEGIRPAYERHGIPFGLSVLMVALALAATGTPTAAVADTVVSSKAQAPAQPTAVPMPGVFAGEHVNGVPVYRLPAVVVLGTRKEVSTSSLQPCRQTIARAAKSAA